MSTQPWVEKYRPQLLKDVVGNEETVAKLQAVVNGGNMPNIILSGLLAASRRVEAPSLHSHASSPGMMDVGGFFFEFEVPRRPAGHR
jgi:hypothetical protein